MSTKRWYMAIVQFNTPVNELAARLKRDVPIINTALKKLSSDDHCNIATRSHDGQTVVWILQTTVSPSRVTSQLVNPEAKAEDWTTQSKPTPDTILPGDKTLVFELGEGRYLTGMNQLQGWLTRMVGK